MKDNDHLHVGGILEIEISFLAKGARTLPDKREIIYGVISSITKHNFSVIMLNDFSEVIYQRKDYTELFTGNTEGVIKSIYSSDLFGNRKKNTQFTNSIYSGSKIVSMLFLGSLSLDKKEDLRMLMLDKAIRLRNNILKENLSTLENQQAKIKKEITFIEEQLSSNKYEKRINTNRCKYYINFTCLVDCSIQLNHLQTTPFKKCN